LAKLTLSDEPQTSLSRIKPLEEKSETLEAELSVRTAAEFPAQAQPVTLSAIQAALPAASVLIEFVVYKPSDPQTGKSRPPRQGPYMPKTP